MGVSSAGGARGAMRFRAGGSDTREEIVAASERLFRTVGYRKTTIADVASELGMSPANVYRFFASKAEINEAVAERVLDGIAAELAAVARSDLTPPERLRRLLLDWAAMSESRLMGDGRMHDMVEVAMAECWAVCDAYKARVAASIACVIADGAATGDFAVREADQAAECVRAAMTGFVDPAIMSRRESGPELAALVGFILAALGARAARA
jgi:AcrR family transcriptional regulator